MILFHYWIDQDGLELPAQAQFLQGDGSFGFGLFSAVILSAENGNPPEITIPIQANYFELVSFNLNPGTPSAEDFFCPQLPSLEIVYQNDGSILLCAMINTIGDIDFHQGYQVFCSEAEELTVTGAPIDLAETHYSLMDGRWNWLGHPYRVPVSVEDALAGIMDDLVIIQNDEGRFWIPGLVNTLGTMQPGDGYAVFVNQDLDFTYPDIQGVAGFTEDPLPTDQSALDISPTGLPYIVVFTTGENSFKGRLPGSTSTMAICWLGEENFPMMQICTGRFPGWVIWIMMYLSTIRPSRADSGSGCFRASHSHSPGRRRIVFRGRCLWQSVS